MDSGVEQIAEDPVKQQLQRQARMVHLKSFAASALITIVTLLIP